MNNEEARQVLEEKLLPFRDKPYHELRILIGRQPITGEVATRSSTCYQFEIEVFWDDKRDGNIRVMGTIDDGGGWTWRLPLCSDFIKAPDNTFVGE
jgi:hypothetical protein